MKKRGGKHLSVFFICNINCIEESEVSGEFFSVFLLVFSHKYPSSSPHERLKDTLTMKKRKIPRHFDCRVCCLDCV